MQDHEFDSQHIWHPYNRIPTAMPHPCVTHAQGSMITLDTGQQLIDGMSSWWSAIHGYNHPTINQAASAQLNEFSHMMFGGLTHPAAIKLAKQLVAITPQGLDKIFFADSGSVSIEVALKVALQYWRAKQQPQKNRFVALYHGYHGDTFGAMSVCDPINGMHHLFQDNLMPNYFAQAPLSGQPQHPLAPHSPDLESLKQILQQHQHQIAALVLEPLVQGAGGMRFYPAAYLKEARSLCDQYDVLLIADEIATGFGRTGKLFACNWAQVTPDIMCIGKALTGGYMTLAAMLCQSNIADAISQSKPGLLMHGPTFMANPLACAVASASIELLLSNPWPQQVAAIETQLKAQLNSLTGVAGVKDVRVLGAIGVVELERDDLGAYIQQAALELGIWIRPHGRLIYTMPAYNISESLLEQLAQGMVNAIKKVLD